MTADISVILLGFDRQNWAILIAAYLITSGLITRVLVSPQHNNGARFGLDLLERKALRARPTAAAAAAARIRQRNWKWPWGGEEA